jgi:hypothetical protein
MMKKLNNIEENKLFWFHFFKEANKLQNKNYMSIPEKIDMASGIVIFDRGLHSLI